jgi:uncharacterized hydrophobic protein (TIGR00271 family)
MSLVHIRVISPAPLSQQVDAVLTRQPGATNIVVLRGAAQSPRGDLFQADLAREAVQQVVSELRDLGVDRDGSISWRPVDTAIGDCMEAAERAAPGDGADAIIWDEVVASTGEDSSLTWTFMTFMVLACILAAIGVATNSPITIVGAMVVGPEFGPLAGIAVGLRLRRRDAVRRGVTALVAGFAGAIAVTAAVGLLWRVTGLVSEHDLGASTGTEFIYQPGWFSVITALVAGAADVRQVGRPSRRVHLGHHHPGGRQRRAGPGLRALPRCGRLSASAAHQPHRHCSRRVPGPARTRSFPFP